MLRLRADRVDIACCALLLAAAFLGESDSDEEDVADEESLDEPDVKRVLTPSVTVVAALALPGVVRAGVGCGLLTVDAVAVGLAALVEAGGGCLASVRFLALAAVDEALSPGLISSKRSCLGCLVG